MDKIGRELRLYVPPLFVYLGKKNAKEATKPTLAGEGESKVNLANSSNYW